MQSRASNLRKTVSAKQSMQWTLGILRDVQAFFWLRVFPAPTQTGSHATHVNRQI